MLSFYFELSSFIRNFREITFARQKQKKHKMFLLFLLLCSLIRNFVRFFDF